MAIINDLFPVLYQHKRMFTRYISTMFKHMTLKRFFNVCIVEWENLLGRSCLKGHPYQVIIDPSNICMLKCPLCFTGRGNSGRPQGQMSFDLFKKIIDETKHFGLHVFLHNWGEPLLHKNIYDFIGYANNANLGTTLSSNLSFPINDEEAEKLISSGLETLIVSLDGINRETYETYRRGGNFDQVVANVRLLARKKKQMNKKLPSVEWQFLMMRHNETETEEARKKFREMGFDSLFFAKANLPHNENNPSLAKDWLPVDKKKRLSDPCDKAENIPGRCWWLWRTVVINYDGGVSSCCYIDDKNTDFGNITHTSFNQIWNNVFYRSARGLFSAKETPSNPTVCDSCVIVKKWRTKKYAK